MHYYQHHIGDFIKDTANLNDHQMVTYLRMIWTYYTDEKPLPDDCEGIAFAMRSDEKTVQLLLRHYFELTSEGWRHKRCDRELEAFYSRSEKARISANLRWEKQRADMQSQCDGNANAMRTHKENNANASFLDATHIPIYPINKEEERGAPTAAPSPKKKPTRLPDDWEMSDRDRQYCTAKRPDLDPEEIAEMFKNYWLSASKNATKVDWHLAWCKWVLTEKKSARSVHLSSTADPTVGAI
jgi:uncharacterized protein YdaU (DUF1376 family)